MNKRSLYCAGCIDAFTEKRAVAPALAGIGVLEALLSGVGLYFAGGDIYEGIKDRSLGKTLWGLAQVPMSFAGGGILAGGGRAAWHSRLAHSYPRVAASPGMKRFGRAVDWTERAAEGIGGHLSEGVGKGLHHVGLPRAGDWFKNFGPQGKQMLGFMTAAQFAPTGGGGSGGAAEPGESYVGGTHSADGMTRQGPVWQPAPQNIAPRPDWGNA